MNLMGETVTLGARARRMSEAWPRHDLA